MHERGTGAAGQRDAAVPLPNVIPSVQAFPSDCGTSLKLLLDRPRYNVEAADSEHSSSRRLEQLSVKILLALEEDPTGHPVYSYLAPNHKAQFPGDGVSPPIAPIPTSTREEFVALRATAIALHPEIHLEVLDTTSNVDETQTKATVWIRGFMSHFEIADLKTRETVAMMEWQLFPGCDWMCTKSVFTHCYSGIGTKV